MFSRPGAAVARRQGKLILLSAMSNRVSAVKVVFYQLGSRRASSARLRQRSGANTSAPASVLPSWTRFPIVGPLDSAVAEVHRRAGWVLALGHGVLGRMTGDGNVSSRERPAACGKHPPG
jgi:hypothetical protein